MAKKDTSKTNVTARAAAKAREVKCRICGNKPDVVKVLTPHGKAMMLRKCCVASGVAVMPA